MSDLKVAIMKVNKLVLTVFPIAVGLIVIKTARFYAPNKIMEIILLAAGAFAVIHGLVHFCEIIEKEKKKWKKEAK